MKKQLLVVGFCFATICSFAQTSVKGYVYEDTNANGKRDKKEVTLSGISVSNGVDVVQTDAKGQYVLPLTGDDQIFVIKPSNYVVALDEYNIPEFFVTHKPNGSPKTFKYAGVAPTGKLPKEVNFGLIPHQEAKDFKVVVFGDPQPYTEEELLMYKTAVVEEVKQRKLDFTFGISLGDIVGDDLDLHQPYKEIMKEIGLPWYNVIGNHDMNFDAKVDKHSDETFEKNFGPANYAFNYGDAHFLILDDILYPHPLKDKGYWGGFREDQIAFIQNDLKFVPKDKLVVVSLHIPLFIGGEEHFDPTSRQQLLNALSKFDNVLVMSAHTHYQMHQFYGKSHGYKGVKPIHEYNVGTTSGDWYSGELDEQGVPVSTMRDGTPRGYALLTIKDNQYVLDYKVTGREEDYRMEVFMPKVIGNKRSGNSFIYANVFMGTEEDKVEFSVDGGAWKKLSKVDDYDPTFYASVQKYDLAEELLSGRRPSNPIKSSHLWRGKLPFNLGVGEHKVVIRVKDRYGREHTTTKTYQIAPLKMK